MPISLGTPGGGGGGSGTVTSVTAADTTIVVAGTATDPTVGAGVIVAPATHAAASKATPVDADELPVADSAASFGLKKLTWANLKATVKSYTDTLYPAGSGTSTGTNTGDQTGVSGNAGTATKLATARTIDGTSFDGTANVTVIAPGTDAAASKATPVDGDELPLVDSAASFVLKKLTWANVKATLKTYFDTLYVSSSGAVTSVFGRTGAVTNAANQVLQTTTPSLTASASALMLGAAGSVTPQGTRIFIAIAGKYNMLATTAPLKLEGRYGTGTAPTQNAAVTGTAYGTALTSLETAATARFIPFTLIGIVTGLSAGTAYWLDVAFTGDGTNQPQIGQVTLLAFDV